ncbi:Serine/threonine-protein kinase SMG1 [Rhynchospora pubera]|uniref:non-specific serine/threonine protein kinase n=1 Tax=Rhynchospora pubera TaxID=906938 RepID=A0AAV8HGR5_9POAL|nr:Serine/threonine-protein kinase SMG1 [Rhynchospora pubera]
MQNPHQHQHHHHLRHPRPPHQQQNLHQQLVSLLSAASSVDSTSSPSASRDGSSANDAPRLAALDSLQRTIAFPPNSLLLPASAPFLAQGLSPLFSDQSYAVSRAAVVAYGTLCGVLCSPLANQGQPYPAGGGLPDGFVAWALPLLRDTSNPPVVELALEGLRAMLSAGDPAGLDRFIHPIVRACQDVLEDDRTSLALLRQLLGLLSLLSAKFVHSFRPHFADIVDVLLGWAFVPDLSDSDRGLIMDTFFQFQGHWLSSLPFSLGLLSKFLGDMEVLGGPSSTSGARLSALLSCFSTLLGVMASAAVTDARLLDQMVGPLQSITPRLLRCMSTMFGSDVVGQSKWMGESWQCVILMAQILRERFAGFYEMAVDIVSHCLSGAVPSFQLDAVLKSNMRILSVQGTTLLPSSVKAILQFHRPISQLRLHPNNIIVAGAVTTYLFFLQHGSDGVVSQAISCLLEELEVLKEMLEKVYSQFENDSTLSLQTSSDKKREVLYSEEELLSLINFDLKVLLTSINFAATESPPDQRTLDAIKYARATRLASFLLHKFTPLNMPLSGSPELQLNIFRTLRKLSEVELSSNSMVFKTSYKEGVTDLSSPREGRCSDLGKIYLDRYGIFLTKALDSSQPLALKLEALDWIRYIGQLFLTLKEKPSCASEIHDSAKFPSVGLFALLDLTYDLESKVRYEAASSLEALLLSGLVDLSLYPATALVALDKLGDPDSSTRDKFLMVVSIAVPATVHYCNLHHHTTGNVSRKNPLVSMVHLHCMNWRHVLAVKPSARKFHSQQFVTISSYIANRGKLPLSSWVQRTVSSCRARNDVPLSQQDTTTDANVSEELLQDAKMASSLIDRMCPVSTLAAIWWCIHEAARYTIHLRLRTNLGGPAQTFAAFERMLLDVPNLLTSDANKQADTNLIGSTSEVSLLPMRLLLDFVESLKKNIYNAYEGSFLLPSAAKPSIVFFRANKKVCEEWFSRICDPMLNASLALHCKDATFHYCGIRLTDLRNTVLSSFKERTQEGISILRDNTRIGADVLKFLRHAALALCQNHEADALFGLQKWAEASLSPLFGSSVKPFSWISGLAYQAEGRYEMAAAYYSHLLQSEEALGSMDSDGIQFIVSCMIECYTSLSDWKCLENWLTELQTLRSVHAGKPYSGALTTTGKEMNAIHALARFDEEDYTAAWTYLDLTPKSSSELTLDSKIALERSEQMLIRSMLIDSTERGGSKEGAIEKARLMLHEALSVAPLDGITTEAAAYAAQLHCISAFEEVTKSDDQNKLNRQPASVVGSVSQLFPMDRTHQDCGMWMKVLRVYRFVQPNSLPTLYLSQKLLGLARKQGNFMLAHRMKHYLLNHSLMSSAAQEIQQELLNLSTQYESILLKYAEGNSEEALTQLWLFVSADLLSGAGSLTSFGSNISANVKARACLKLSAWLSQESSINFSTGIFSKIIQDFNASCGVVPEAQKLFPANFNCDSIFQELTGIVAKTATRLCPTMGKTWLSYASWCFSLAKNSCSATGPLLSSCSLSSVLEAELSPASHHFTDEEMSKVETIVRNIHPEKVEPVSSLVMQVVSLMQCVAGAPGSEARDSGESLSSLLSSQLRALFCTVTSSVEKDEMLGSAVDELVGIWWALRQRRVSLFGHAANGYFQYLSYSSVKLDSNDGHENFSRGKAKSNTLRAVLKLLHIMLNYGLELNEALGAGLSTVPVIPWQEIIPQLFARLSSHPEKVVRKQLEGLLMLLGKLSPCSIVYPTLVNINASEGNPTDELQHILDLLVRHYPKLVEDVRLVIDELGMMTVLWEEQWLSTLQDLHSDVMRRINMLKEEAARIAANPTLSITEKGKINTTKYSAMMAPVIVALERRLATTSREPRTPHEAWFRKEYGEQLASAISALKTPPTSSTTLGEVWRQFEAIAASLMTHHRKSSVLMSAVAPNLACVSTSEIPMPGFEKQITTDAPCTVTVASFCEQVIVLSTKTKPKKLVLRGSDGQKYTYLLKGREDLRLDARIMQLLEAINSFLGSFQETRSRSLAIRYYSVTPISGRAGLIQWVENVSSIYSVYKSWQKRTQLAQAQVSGVSNGNNEASVAPVPRPSDMFYGKIIPALKEKGIRKVISRRDWPHDVKRKVFLELMQETPRQLLWQEMWCASEGFRSFNLKIKRFSGSVAAMSMVGHILGLGDRHLDNILMDLCTGDIVHIDYNVCFDKGKRLKIPEIVPFRLTQIMEAALGLSGIEGTFRASCEAVMTALQRNKDLILMLLEVFVWEPLMEWTRGGNTEDEAVLVGEEKKGMDLAVSLSLFSSRLQEIRVPLQEHHDLLIASLPAAESALKSLLDEFVQYEVRSSMYSHAEKERSTLSQQESSANSLLAEAAALSENSRASFELQSRELAQAKSVAADKAQELAIWVDLHAQVLDSLREGSIPAITSQMVDNAEDLSLISAVVASGVPLSVVPEPTKSLCADLDKDISILITELNSGISNATNSLKKYALVLRRVLPSNYITTSPISGWAQILQLSVSNLSGDMLSLSKREASELLSKAQGEGGVGFSLGGALVKQRYLELINKIESHIAEMGRLNSECSELMNSTASNKETQSRERLFAATVKYVQSPGNAGNEEKRAKVLLVLGMAVKGIYLDARSKVLDLSSNPFQVGGLVVGDSGGSPKNGYKPGFQEFEEQIEKCVLVSGFVNQVEEAIGIKLSGADSSEEWASTFQGILNAINHIIEKMSEVAIPELLRRFFSQKSEIMELFSSLSQIRGAVNSAIEKLIEVELERASMAELEQNYFAKAGLIKEQQLVLEEAAARGRDHLSWEEADELASQEESCRAQLEQLHLTWNQKDMRLLSLRNMETNLINSLVSSEQYLSSLLATNTNEGGRSFVSLLASLIEPFSELESLDLLLPSEFGGSLSVLPDVVSSVSFSKMIWALSGLLNNHAFFAWKVGLVGSIFDSCLHEISSTDHNFSIDELYGSLKRKLMALLHEHAQQYLKERVSPSLVHQLDKEIGSLQNMGTSDERSRDHLGAVNRVVSMLEEYCNAHEITRAAQSSISLMKRQVSYLTDALGMAVLEAAQLEWLHNISSPYTFKSMLLSQNIFGNDEAFSLILNLSRKELLDEIQSSISSIVRSVEGLQGFERASLPIEGQLDRAMGWACSGSSSMIPSEFRDHLLKRKNLLGTIGDQASCLVEICTSIIEFEASRDGLFLASDASNSYTEKGRMWQPLLSTYLTQLDTAYHSFTCAEQEWKLTQHNMDTATSTLLSISSQLSMASAKAKTSLADIQETLAAMKAHAREAIEALSAFSRVSKGHSALTSESGSLIEEVLAITEGLHDIYSLGKEASTAHSALMTDLSKANSILLPLETSLAADLSDALHENESNNSLGSRSLFVHGKALYQSYNFKVREACQALVPLVPSLTFHATHLHSMLIKLGRTSSLHAGNLHKALEGIGDSQGVRSEELSLSKSVVTLQEADTSSEKEKGEATAEDSSVVCNEKMTLQDEYWISPPIDSYTSSSNSSSPDAVAETIDMESSQVKQDHLSVTIGASVVQQLDVVDKDAFSEVRSDAKNNESHANAQPPTTDDQKTVSDSSRPVWGKNEFALSVLKLVEQKLQGRDLHGTRSIGISELVEHLVKQATSIDNLCNMYEGWTPWI